MMTCGLRKLSFHPARITQFPPESIQGFTHSAFWLTWASASMLIFFSWLLNGSVWVALVLISILTWPLSFITEVWHRPFPNGPSLSQCYSGGPATRLFRHQNLSHVGEADLSGCRWQLWPQTHQHHEVSPESALSWSYILCSGPCFSFRRWQEM